MKNIINKLRIWWLFKQCDPDFLIWAFGPNHKNLSLNEKWDMWNFFHNDICFMPILSFLKHNDVKYRLSIMGKAWTEWKLQGQEFAALVE